VSTAITDTHAITPERNRGHCHRVPQGSSGRYFRLRIGRSQNPVSRAPEGSFRLRIGRFKSPVPRVQWWPIWLHCGRD